MKCRTFIDKEHEEEVVIYAHERNELVQSIERLAFGSTELIGYTENEAVMLQTSEVYCFSIEGNKLYALTQNEKLQVKFRLYQVEDMLNENFVKINQSCIANIRKIERFDASVSGTMRVKFKNGHTDYISRRQLKNVKERLGL